MKRKNSKRGRNSESSFFIRSITSKIAFVASPSLSPPKRGRFIRASSSMRPTKREPPALEDSLPKKSARPRRSAAMKESPMEKKNKGGKPDVAATEVEVDRNSTTSSNDGPFPSWRRPSPAECFAARDALALLHGEPGAIPAPPPPSSSSSSPPRPSTLSPSKKDDNNKVFSDPDGCHNDGCLSVLDSLVRTILSQNTTDATSIRAFRSLKRALPTWERARTAPPGVMEEAIRVGGLADIKAARIREILETLRAEALERRRREGGGGSGVGGGKGAEKEGKEEEKQGGGEKKRKKASGGETAAAAAGAPADLREFNNSLLSLEYLREWPDAEEIKGELVRFNGVGPKTAGEFSFLFFFFFPVQIKCDINTDKKKPTTTTTKKKKRSTQHVSSSLP